jgi:hypothetical protein
MNEHTLPTTVGLYLYTCEEFNGDWEHAAITNNNGHLFVHEEYLGTTPLEIFDNELIDIKWKKIA